MVAGTSDHPDGKKTESSMSLLIPLISSKIARTIFRGSSHRADRIYRATTMDVLVMEISSDGFVAVRGLHTSPSIPWITAHSLMRGFVMATRVRRKLFGIHSLVRISIFWYTAYPPCPLRVFESNTRYDPLAVSATMTQGLWRGTLICFLLPRLCCCIFSSNAARRKSQLSAMVSMNPSLPSR